MLDVRCSMFDVKPATGFWRALAQFDVRFLIYVSIASDHLDTNNHKKMNTRTRYFTFYWLPIIIYCALIFIQSSFPTIEDVPSFEYMDKLLHFLAYGFLGILFFRAYATKPVSIKTGLSVLFGVLSASLYGASDEIHQHFVPQRSADIIDFAADTLGSFVGVILYLAVVKIRNRTDHQLSIR